VCDGTDRVVPAEPFVEPVEMLSWPAGRWVGVRVPLAGLVGQEFGVRLDPEVGREIDRRLARQQDVWRLLHHDPRRGDGVTHARQRRDRPDRAVARGDPRVRPDDAV